MAKHAIRNTVLVSCSATALALYALFWSAAPRERAIDPTPAPPRLAASATDPLDPDVPPLESNSALPRVELVGSPPAPGQAAVVVPATPAREPIHLGVIAARDAPSEVVMISPDRMRAVQEVRAEVLLALGPRPVSRGESETAIDGIDLWPDRIELPGQRNPSAGRCLMAEHDSAGVQVWLRPDFESR